jgi:hypothetical protein
MERRIRFVDFLAYADEHLPDLRLTARQIQEGLARDAAMARERTADTSSMQSSVAKPPVLNLDDAHRTDVERVEAWLANGGEAILKLSEWSEIVVAVSLRELKRAAKSDVVGHHTPRVGPRRNAACTTAEHLLTYLRTRDRVLRKTIPEPDWWTNVYLGKPGRKAA